MATARHLLKLLERTKTPDTEPIEKRLKEIEKEQADIINAECEKKAKKFCDGLWSVGGSKLRYHTKVASTATPKTSRHDDCVCENTSLTLHAYKIPAWAKLDKEQQTLQKKLEEARSSHAQKVSAARIDIMLHGATEANTAIVESLLEASK